MSIQLEKVGPRDEMLSSFVKKKQAVGGQIKTPVRFTQIVRQRMRSDILLTFCRTTGGGSNDQKEAHHRLSQEVCEKPSVSLS